MKLKFAAAAALLAFSTSTLANTQTDLLTISSIEARNNAAGIYDFYFNEDISSLYAAEGCNTGGIPADRVGIELIDTGSFDDKALGLYNIALLAMQNGWSVRLKVDGCINGAIERPKIKKIRAYAPQTPQN
ncbi:MAG: hypothetical protein ACWA5R_11210 [bacterium]